MARDGEPGRHLAVLLGLALACLAAGLTLPIVEVTNLWVFEGSYSVLGGIRVLFSEGDWFVGGVIAAFSVFLPTAKIVALMSLWARLRRGAPPWHWLPSFIEEIGKWSMLDVFVVAMLVFAAKASTLADANVAPAVFPFMASIVLTVYCARSLRLRLARGRDSVPH